MIDTSQIARVALDCLHQDHLDVAAMLNQLLSGLESDVPDEILTAQFDSLVEHCVNHFFCEEKQMGSFNYPQLGEHSAEHQRAAAEVGNVQQRWQESHDRQRLAHYLRNTFGPWLLDHIERLDTEASRFIYDAGGR